MKKLFPLILCLLFASSALAAPTLLYQGHGSLRITTEDNKVIYIDPYAGEGYDLPADLILAYPLFPIPEAKPAVDKIIRLIRSTGGAILMISYFK